MHTVLSSILSENVFRWYNFLLKQSVLFQIQKLTLNCYEQFMKVILTIKHVNEPSGGFRGAVAC